MTAYHLEIRPARRVSGSLPVPGDKSISHRYAMLAAISSGTTHITHLAPGADVAATVDCLRALGAGIADVGPHEIRVVGTGLASPVRDLEAANSGTTMRLLAGLVAGYSFRSTVTGDESLSRRPMRRVIDPLTAMGATIASRDGRAPLVVDGRPLTAIDWTTPVPSAQVKSAILLAALRAQGTTIVREPLATRDHTERAFPTFGLECRVEGSVCSVTGGQRPIAPTISLFVPGDPSSSAVWAAAAAALPGSAVHLTGVCLNPHRLGFARALERMGAVVTAVEDDQLAGEPVGSLRVAYGEPRTVTIAAAEVPSLIDELPVLAACAALGGGLEVTGAGELRHKESDRITALVAGFKALGVEARELPDGFVIEGCGGSDQSRPTGGIADAAGDHRLVMAFTLVALGAKGPSIINGADAVGISYPGFEHDLARLTR